MPALQEVRFETHHNTDEEVRVENVRATFQRGYVRFNELLHSAKGRPMSVVGSGPSLSWTYKDLKGDVMACNSAHDFLISKGIIPKYAMFWDANPIIAEMARKPHPDVTYLVASRCHPDLFKALAGHRVVVFHALGGEPVDQFLIAEKRMEPLIAGGSSGVTRGLYLAGAMGHTEVHLFGIDSSYDDEATHVGGSVIDQKKMKLRVCGKWFVTAPWMAVQAADFKVLAPLVQKMGMRLIVHGTGLIPYTATFLDCETPDIKVTIFEKLRRHIHGLILLYLFLRNSPNYLEASHAGI